jgi:hypothetical protein
MKNYRIRCIALSFLICIGCIPESVKEKVDTALKDSQALLADLNFKNALAYIELHKLRYGSYPSTLKDLTFVNTFDSAFFDSVEYIKLDSGYELNLTGRYVGFDQGNGDEIKLNYPDEFWQGLGCVKSNIKK